MILRFDRLWALPATFAMAAAIAYLAPSSTQAGDATGLHAPTPAEQAVIDTYAHALSPFIDSLANDDWQEDEGQRYDIGADVQVHDHPDGVPIAFDATIGRYYNVLPGSNRGNNIIVPYQAKVDALTAQLQAATDEVTRAKIVTAMSRVPGGDEVQAQHFYVGTSYNITNLTPAHAYPRPLAMALPGVAMIYQVEPAQVPKGEGYILLFGDWQHATWDTKHGWLHYNFKNASGTPHVENVAITIEGPDDYLQSVLKSADWEKVAAALTP